jgi:uncharacterized protein (DUF2235 family)
VIKLYSVLDHDPTRQIAYYHPGLGTMEPAGALTSVSRKVSKLFGQAIGYGLSNDIRSVANMYLTGMTVTTRMALRRVIHEFR